ncbi:ATP-grasp domain-containing protein [Faecalibaculum rodentium]|uniref:ATP-grasp domain-containing protein n=1 Tax=Faecalibaculum rodentium TaxID=1702221 RepID=UPI0023F50AC8|nr:ATP-grasp domain-containing protein [Faecalibaculum rodentium]
MNILLTSVGRRAYMVKYFKEAVGDYGKVHVCNSDKNSIAFRYADEHIISPLIYDEKYIPFILDYCQENSIDIVVSLFDIDLLVLAQHKNQFEELGIHLIVSDIDIIEICNDKWKTFKFLEDNGFKTPKTYLKLDDITNAISHKELSYPVVVKPRYGCGSISISLAYNEDDLKYLTRKVNKDIEKTYLKFESAITEEKVIYQEYLMGQEFGADIINDLQGKTQNVILREKIAMRSGETDIAKLVDIPIVNETLYRLGNILKHIANMDCDIFLVDGKPYVLEMNARFGGGYPFSHLAGCNLPKAIVDWANGKEVDNDVISAKTGITGYKEIYITEY